MGLGMGMRMGWDWDMGWGMGDGCSRWNGRGVKEEGRDVEGNKELLRCRANLKLFF
jgi:hypothetical protein